MQTISVDILNSKAIRFLQNLELLQLIRVRKEENKVTTTVNLVEKYKGSMQKQSQSDIDHQLNELRNEWEQGKHI